MTRLLAAALCGFLAAAPFAGPAAATGLSGSYLAALQADMRDDYAAAADYYGRALARDPDNVVILQNAAVMAVAAGDFPAAVGFAQRLAETAPASPIVVATLVADALARGDFDAAEAALEGAGPEANVVLVDLLRGWIAAGRDDFGGAQAIFDGMTANEALAAFGQYHKALALALAGDFVSAEAILAGGEEGPLHLSRAALVAHAQILAQIERTDEAVALLDEALLAGYPAPGIAELRDALAAGVEVPFTQVTRAQDGAAEVFTMMAEGLANPDSQRLALVYARLAMHIRPDLVEPTLIAADVLAAEGQFALAEAALASIPAESPWSVTAEIRRASAIRDSGDVDGAIAALQALALRAPEEAEVQAALGDHLRMADRFAEAAVAYGAAVDLIGPPQPGHWGLFYSRAIAYERSGDWPAAEADFRKALELNPEQPSVLNYLGYSLVEQKRDLDEALDMIERAVAGQPDDGYITDSLGWVLYRLERYEEALPHMLRAVELEPVDPIINDHLGDVLWKVGRKREAEFQWRRALSFGPADDLDMERVRRKLEVGLDAVYAEEPAGDNG